jgi:hypothetical protein
MVETQSEHSKTKNPDGTKGKATVYPSIYFVAAYVLVFAVEIVDSDR